MARILVVDDEPGLIVAMSALVRSAGHEPVPAHSGEQALQLLDQVEVVVADHLMPGMDGMQLLNHIRARNETTPVILLTAHGSERLAVRAIKAGAYDYLAKPFDFDEMTAAINRAVEARELRIRNRLLLAERAIGRPLIGDSPAMRRLTDAISRVAPRDLTVLVRGETGTGKEIVASLIHAQSRRAEGPLVRFNCAAIPETLADAELFGHVRGAFTGAVTSRQGYFEQAAGGTLVLDEVGELPLPVQAKMLRALQSLEIQPVGASKVARADVRVIACTNRDLEADARAGRFRSDLYYRLAVVELVVPPLRERREDIPSLVSEFARRFADQFGLERVEFSRELIENFRLADWPGNVRQLENIVGRLIAMAPGPEIGLEAITGYSLASSVAPEGARAAPEGPPEFELGVNPLRSHLAGIERSILERALASARGNQSEAARLLGLSRSAFVDRLKKFDIPV